MTKYRAYSRREDAAVGSLVGQSRNTKTVIVLTAGVVGLVALGTLG